MSDSGIVMEIAWSELPLCPNVIGIPTNPLHELHTKMLNQIYKNAQKDEDDEFVNPETDKIYSDLAYTGSTTDRMNLYFARNGWFQGSTQIIVESFWYKCKICGLILPANRLK